MKSLCRFAVAVLLGSLFVGAGAPPASPAMDFSTPRAALLTYFTLVEYGDLDALAKVSAVPTNDAEKMAAEVASEPTVWAPHLIVAFHQYFAANLLTNIPDPRGSLDGYKAYINNTMVATETGDTAIIKKKKDPSDPPPAEGAEEPKIVLRKEAGKWKIVLKESTLIPCLHNPTDKQVEFFKALRDCYADTATDVLAGKYATPAEAAKANDARIKAVQNKYLHPTTLPAGK